MRAAVLALGPAVAVAGREQSECARLIEAPADPPLDLGAERGKTAVLDRVFEAGMLAVRPVAPVALHGDDRLGDRDRVLRPAEADEIAGARIGVGLAVGHAHASADHHVEARHVAAPVEDGDEAEIMGVDVDVVRGRHRDRDLEFPRQIGPAVDRLARFFLAAGGALAVGPDLAVGAGGVAGWGMARAVWSAPACARDWNGFGLHITLRLTSPQAAMVVSSAPSMAASADFRFDLITPWSCTDCRVVSRTVPLA